MADRTETNESIIRRLQAAGDTPEAAEIMGELWQRNTRLVSKAVHDLTGLTEDADGFEDMTQQAYFGFRAAAYSFDPEAGASFSTYVVKQIRWELSRYYERNGYMVRIPAYIKRRLRDCMERKRQLEAETGRSVTYAAALADLGYSQTVIAGTLAAFRRLESTSLDSVYTESADGDGATLLDLIASGEDVEEAAISQEWHRELHAVLMAALQEVPEDMCGALIRQYFHGISARRIADEMGITRQTLYDRKAEAFQTMRNGRHGAELAEFMPTSSSYERARRMIQRDREAVERLQLTEAERGLLAL